MAHKQLILVIVLDLISRALSITCPPSCDKSLCETPSDCIAGIITDPCGCCDECARSYGEECGGPWVVSGCGDGLTCDKEHGSLPHEFGDPSLQYGICIEGVCEDSWLTRDCLDPSQIPALGEICSCSDILLSGHCVTPLYGEHICMRTCGHHCTTQHSWTPVTNACIRGYNSLILDRDFSLEDCKDRCQAQFDFECRSIEYDAQGRRCVLSGGNSSSSNYVEPCYIEGWTYTELSENVPIPVADAPL